MWRGSSSDKAASVCRLVATTRCLLLPIIRIPVSTSPSSNRTCRFPASGFRTRLHAFAHACSRPCVFQSKKPAVPIQTGQSFRFKKATHYGPDLAGHSGSKKPPCTWLNDRSNHPGIDRLCLSAHLSCVARAGLSEPGASDLVLLKEAPARPPEASEVLPQVTSNQLLTNGRNQQIRTYRLMVKQVRVEAQT